MSIESDGHDLIFLSGLPNPATFISGREILIDACFTTSVGGRHPRIIELFLLDRYAALADINLNAIGLLMLPV